ncbi:MAG: Spy/CpxP family protein refolding chaperone [Methylotenera sp.]|nr:Spy/CpxP family protein refolding chaperone [Methylotenera sp.]
MKNLSIKQLLAISALAIALPFSASSYAGSGNDCHKHDSKRGHGYKHSGHSGQAGMPHHFKALNLTQDQQDKMFAIMHEQAPAKYAQHKQQRETMEALRTLAQADTFDEAKAQQLADQLGRLEKEKALNRLKTEAKINALLTPEQRQKAREFKPSHRGGHGIHDNVRFKNKPTPAVKPTNS